MRLGPLSWLGAQIDSTLPWMRRARLLNGPRKKSRPDMELAETETGYLRYRSREGARPTLVLVPDPPIVLEHYDELLTALEGRSTLVIEAPGAGFSIPKPGFDFAFDPWIEVFPKFLRALDRGPYVLAFPCIAGFASLAIAHRHPDLV